jgi:hypothetical protein
MSDWMEPISTVGFQIPGTEFAYSPSLLEICVALFIVGMLIAIYAGGAVLA